MQISAYAKEHFFARDLHAMRLAAGLSQREYATLCGISLAALQQVESGKNPDRFQTRTLEKLLRPFGYRIGVVRASGRGKI